MSAVFFQELGLPEPDVQIPGGKASAVRQTARIMTALEKHFLQTKPDRVIVIGDITSTLAGALTAKQLGIKLAHVEAGLRSHDRTMPEELNRLIVDHLSDRLFATEEAAVRNLRVEGIPSERIHQVGNVLTDALEMVLPLTFRPSRFSKPGRSILPTGPVGLFTFHRPSNVDNREGLTRIIELLRGAASRLPVIFPVHPRTRRQLNRLGLYADLKTLKNVYVTASLRYSEMVFLMQQARLVVTDSGGVQEETTYLGTPCLTFRQTTERPVTVNLGTNTLIADLNPESAFEQIDLILAGQYKTGQIPPLWDGHAAERIVGILGYWDIDPLDIR